MATITENLVWASDVSSTGVTNPEYSISSNDQRTEFQNNSSTDWIFELTNLTYTPTSITNVQVYHEGKAPAGADTNTVSIVGLTNQHKNKVSAEAHTLLSPTDWYASRKAEAGTAIPSAVGTYRAAVRTKAADMHTKIDAADTVDKLAALYVYNTDNPPTRPLGEWPDPVE